MPLEFWVQKNFTSRGDKPPKHNHLVSFLCLPTLSHWRWAHRQSEIAKYVLDFFSCIYLNTNSKKNSKICGVHPELWLKFHMSLWLTENILNVLFPKMPPNNLKYSQAEFLASHGVGSLYLNRVLVHLEGRRAKKGLSKVWGSGLKASLLRLGKLMTWV